MLLIVKKKRNQPHDGSDVGISRRQFYNYCYKYVQVYKEKDGNRHGIATEKGNYKKGTVKNTKISRMEIYRTEK